MSTLNKLLSVEQIKKKLIKQMLTVDTATMLIEESKGNENVTLHVNNCSVEASAHISENNKKYLLEVRLFNKNDDMLNVYLEVLDSDLNLCSTYIDDVWSYANWKRIV